MFPSKSAVLAPCVSRVLPPIPLDTAFISCMVHDKLHVILFFSCSLGYLLSQAVWRHLPKSPAPSHLAYAWRLSRFPTADVTESNLSSVLCSGLRLLAMINLFILDLLQLLPLDLPKSNPNGLPSFLWGISSFLPCAFRISSCAALSNLHPLSSMTPQVDLPLHALSSFSASHCPVQNSFLNSNTIH